MDKSKVLDSGEGDWDMSSEQEAILRFGIEIEKMLCEKLGKQWRPSGMSIESLVEEMSAKANAPSAYVHLPKDPDRFIALHPGDRLIIEARNPAPAPAVVRQPLSEEQIAYLHKIADALAEGSRSARTLAEEIRKGTE